MIQVCSSAFYLIPAEMVDDHHADEDDEHAEALEGENSQTKNAVLSNHTGGVVFTVGAAFLTGQTVARRSLVHVRAKVHRFNFSVSPCERRKQKE